MVKQINSLGTSYDLALYASACCLTLLVLQAIYTG